MILFLAIAQLVFLIFFIYRGSKKQGLTFWVDPSKIFIILWVTTICLYNFQLSSLYEPTLEINLVAMFIIVLIILLLGRSSITKGEVIERFEQIKKEDAYKRYNVIINIIFIIGVTVFTLNVLYYGLAILKENRIDKQPMQHYSAYLVYMLTLCAQVKYIVFRTFRSKWDLAILITSVGVLFLTLNRGPIFFLITTIYIYEVIGFIRIKDKLSKRKLLASVGALLLAVIITLQLFNYVGNIRIKFALNKNGKTIQQHYRMNEMVPSSLVWGYMYLTSPLDNAAFSLKNQEVEYTYFNKLLYPFIKFSANIVGQGDEYKQWLNSRKSFVPHLQKNVGLNVSSFITEAYQDLGYIGLLFYIGIYCALVYFTMRIIKRKTLFSSIAVFTIYSNTLNMLLWSVFVNSLKIQILLMNLILVVAVEFEAKFKLFSKMKAFGKKGRQQ
jgi:oligosaccharide repeat unit polymerase